MVTRIKFEAPDGMGAYILHYVWHSLPRHGEEAAWTSHTAMADYVDDFDDWRRGLRPRIPFKHKGPHAAITVGEGGTTIRAWKVPRKGCIYEWDVDMSFRPCPRSADLLIKLLDIHGIPYETQGD